MPGVEVKDLVKRFGKVTAVDHINLAVNRQVLTLLGPSGCGKTTALRCVAGLEDPDEGEVYIEDRLVSAPRKKILIPPEKRDIGMVFQSYALWPHMTVEENVAYGLKRRHVRRQEISTRVKKALELVELSGLGERYPAQLSGGQQQRVALARSLAYEPKIILLDEPLSNLDAKLRERTRGELKRLLHKIGVTSMYVTHDQEEAFVISDRIIIMNQGKVLQEGSAEEIYERPANEFVADFMGRANILPGKAEEIEGDEVRVAVVGMDEVLHAVKADQISTGDDCTVSMRSNRIAIHEAKPNKTNVLRGEVTLREYKGGMTDYRVRVGTRELVVSTHLSSIEEGRKVYVQIDPENIIIIPKPK